MIRGAPRNVPINERFVEIGTRLTRAFLAEEGTDAIPIDQVLAGSGKAIPKLMLPKRSVRYECQDDPRRTTDSTEDE